MVDVAWRDRRCLLLSAVSVLPVAPPAQAADADFSDDRVVVKGPLDVARGETVDDVVVVDGRVRVAGRATGDVVAMSGPVRVSGTVGGDLLAVSDRARLARGARVEGDVIYADASRSWRSWPSSRSSGSRSP